MIGSSVDLRYLFRHTSETTTESSINKTPQKTIAKTLELGGESITLFYGEDVTQEQADALAEELEAEYPDCDVQMYPGGQSLYYYIVGVE